MHLHTIPTYIYAEASELHFVHGHTHDTHIIIRQTFDSNKSVRSSLAEGYFSEIYLMNSAVSQLAFSLMNQK